MMKGKREIEMEGERKCGDSKEEVEKERELEREKEREVREMSLSTPRK